MEHTKKSNEANLCTAAGTPIVRNAKYGVGKQMHNCLYFHKMYAPQIIPSKVLKPAQEILEQVLPHFHYNCIKWDFRTNTITFQQGLDFDIAREPHVGKYLTVHANGDHIVGHSNAIWHHKWLWVKDDYEGFDVQESKNWSKTWTDVLQETAVGCDRIWKAQLAAYGLE